MKWGTRYGVDYVNRLASMIRRHTRRPTRIICFTEQPHGIEAGVETAPLPPINIPERVQWLDGVSPGVPREADTVRVSAHSVRSLAYRQLTDLRLVAGLGGEQATNTVDVYMHRLRKQLIDAGASVQIQTLRNVGYLLAAPDSATDSAPAAAG